MMLGSWREPSRVRRTEIEGIDGSTDARAGWSAHERNAASMYRWIDHTAELELEVHAASEVDVLGEALAAMGELLGEDEGEGEGHGPAVPRRVVIHAGSRPVLFADWLAELAFLAETEGLVPERIAELKLDPERLEATVEGGLAEPRHLVKAVTYHRLEFGPNGDRWRATAVLDV